MPKLTLDGREVEVGAGASLLAAAEKLGIKIPRLCHNEALPPYGACRLCLVEVHAPGRAPAVQASCCYPAQEGIEVHTGTDRVRRARKIVAELLLARCPDAPAVRRIASELGVEEPRIAKKNDDCIYCGLCVRMCKERMGRAAIGFSGRGPRRRVEPPFGKHNPVCWTCGACDFICPVGKKVSARTSAVPPIPVPNAFNLGLDRRAAAYILYPQAVPNKAALDEDVCVHLQHDVCGICEAVCQAKAIDYSQRDRRTEIEVGAVVLAPGYEPFDPRLKEEYGYGRFPNVLTALEFERVLSASGPFEGKVRRPSDQKPPRRIAFIQCVGSRDADRDYCSSVCCMYATKEAIIAKEHAGAELARERERVGDAPSPEGEGIACDIYFMDLRAFGKGFEEYYIRAKELGVEYIRSRPAGVEEVPETRDLVIRYLGEGERKLAREYGLVVLSTGLGPPKDAARLAGEFGLRLNEHGFCRTSVFAPLDAPREGVYVAGPFTEPKDIPETVTQASGAAARVLALLRDARGTLVAPRAYPPETDVRGLEPRIGVFVCHCGTNIAGVVNVPEVVEYARTLPNVVHAENNLYTCSNDTQARIKDKIREHALNRVVVASCTPRTHEPLFRDTVREGALNPYLFEMANIRDQCSWVHMHEPARATVKAKDLVRMAVAKAGLLEPLRKRSVPVEKAALVLGGGLAGMTAALSLAGQGFEVHLVEREAELGGHLRDIHYLLDGESPKEALGRLRAALRANPRVEVMTEAEVEAIDGTVGSFRTRVKTRGGVREFGHGVVIVAIGAKEHGATEHLHGQDERVITQRAFEARLAAGAGWLRSGDPARPPTVVMIQCVGSRSEERPYCSRICCAEAMKNALKVKDLAPGTAVYVLYRDIRTYGFRERYYTRARQQGVAFVRYDAARKPEVSRNGTGLRVAVFDQTLAMSIEIPADLVVLSTGIAAHEDAGKIAQLLKVPLGKDGFFLEAHMKLRPVDFATEGVFLCGLAHSAKSVEESIVQAHAAAARAASILSQDTIEMEANVSEVVEDACDGCAYCVDTCPYKAITLVEYAREGSVKKIVETDETACKGCGCCQATCPKNAIFVRGFKLEQISAQVGAALGVA